MATGSNKRGIDAVRDDLPRRRQMQTSKRAKAAKMKTYINIYDTHRRCGTQVAEKVVIPTTSSMASSLSSVRDHSSDYDTPATSITAPPSGASPRCPLTENEVHLNQHLATLGTSREFIKEEDWINGHTRRDQLLQEQAQAEADHRSSIDGQRQGHFKNDLQDATPCKRSRRSDCFRHDKTTRINKRLRKRKAHSPTLIDYPNVRPRNLKLLRPTENVLDQEPSELSDHSADSTSTLDSHDMDVLGESDYDYAVEEEEQDHSGDNFGDVDRPTHLISAAAASSHHSVPRQRRSVRRAVDGENARQTSRWEDRMTKERKKLENAHPEILTMWDTLRGVTPLRPPPEKQPATITRKLKSFQLEGLSWMMAQEGTSWKGGLLGDEMGMGKTIQAVSLIMSDYPAISPTLVIVPPVALMQWQNEIQDYTDGKLKVLVYHNTNPKIKNLKIKEMKEYDVIMISYSGLESIYRKESKGWKRDDGIVKENSKIHAIHYHRLILDEAHNIKSRTSSCAKACFALKADYKWCLSGTPVQNRIGEFFSLLRFLQIRPFACYFCKKCQCKELHWNQDDSKRCKSCSHTGFEHVSVFNQELLNPITQGDDPELRRSGLEKLRLITDRIMLRRMKKDYTASMELPPKEVLIHNEFFGEIERDFSSSIMSNTTRTFDTYVSRGVMLNNYANIFGLIMQMRQVANHPDLILKKHAHGGQNILVCNICDETAEEPIRSRCHHEFCRKCAKDYVRSFESETPDCPRCHIPLTIDFDQPDIEQDEENVKKSSIINRIKMENWTSSTKIEMLVYDLYKLRSPKQTHKSIVFSQFTSMLQLVEWRLRHAGFNTVMLDGSMSPIQRQKSIEYFMSNTDVEVFLVSLKAGGVALNLTEASRVFIIDPWWNPAAEWQSADRCHRIGQKRPCVITRLCIEDSVESRMVLLQEKKANMINGTINNDQVAIEKLTPEDMQFLFRGS